MVKTLATEWLSHPSCPRVDRATRDHWRALLDTWIADESMPLYIRKVRGDKGSLLTHKFGRALAPVDNSPAQWACWLALNGERPTLDQIRAWIARDAIPIGLALSAAEGRTAKYRCGLRGAPINGYGWKVCHIEPVGLGRGDIRTAPLDALHEHFRRNLNPGNMFVVPKAWGGLGEMPEMIEAARASLGS